MNRPHAVAVAAAIPLLLTSLRLSAGELPFNAPATELAKAHTPLLHQTARALHDSPASAALRLRSDQHISNLWLFPTPEADTVFARYNLTSGKRARSGAPESTAEHLTVLTVRGGRIIESRELTSPSTELAANEPNQLHWSASIGTGNSARSNTEARNSSHGVPASPHWTASIGTGTATTTHDAKQLPSSGTQPVVAAAAHWTSRIGSGHAVDSTSRAMYASIPNTVK